MNRNVARIFLISAGLIWGLGFIGNKYILDSGWTDSQLLFVRFVSAAFFINLIYIKRVLKASKQLIITALFLGIFLYLGFFFQTWGLEYTTPSNNALVTAGYIIMMPAIAYLFEKRKAPKNTVIAGFITLIGISIITVNFRDLTIAFGDILTFIGAMFYAVHIYFLGKYTKKYDVFALMAYQLISFAILSTSVMFIVDGFPTISTHPQGTFNLYILGILLGFFCSFVAFTFQAIGQKHSNEAEAAILISTESVFGPIFAILFYNDPFSITLLIGMILVFAGIVLSESDVSKLKNRFNNKKVVE